MKNLMMTFILFIITSSVFAKNNLIKPNNLNSQESIHWSFGKNNGMFFLLGPQSQHKLFIQVDNILPGNLTPDPITVICNGKQYRLTSSQSVTCYPHFNDVANMNIAPKDFKNGSTGIYQYIKV